jgi:hypothetical protein
MGHHIIERIGFAFINSIVLDIMAMAIQPF